MGQILPLMSADFQARHLSVVIYWRKRTGIDALQNGHAALILDTVGFNMMQTTYYASWSSTSRGNAFVNRADQATFEDDAENWAGTAVGNLGYHMPNRWVALQGLHIGNMKDAWDQMRGKERAHWKLFDKNCATTVARLLKAGGGDNFATAHKKQAMWWPTDLLRYAKAMGPNVFRTS